MIRYTLLVGAALSAASAARAACLPLPQAMSALQTAGEGKASPARFDGDQASRIIQRLMPDAAQSFDVVLFVPRSDGHASLLLGSSIRNELCMTEPQYVVTGARMVDAIGYSQGSASPAASRADLPAVRRGTPYAQARANLLRGGYSPVPSREGEDRCSVGRQDVCRAYPETEACSGTGLAFCKFAWRSPQGATFSVTTYGEELARLSVGAVSRQ